MTELAGRDDATLATAVAAGDVSALGEIYDRYAPRLLGFCRSMLHRQAEAEDCLQDVFVIAATRLGGLREPALLRSWLFSVARHECLSRLDKRHREVLVDEMFDRPSDDTDPAVTEAMDIELAALLRDAQAGMSDRDRLLLELADRQQLAGDDFAAAIGVSRSTAYTLLARARTTAKKSIGALLVARTGREQCPELDTLLGQWDGELTPLLRKQLARHIEKCSVCDTHRSRVASMAALLGGEGEAFAARLVALRRRILDAAAAAMSMGEPAAFPANGWPPADPVFVADQTNRRRRRLAGLLAIAIVLLLGGIIGAGAISPTHHATNGAPAVPTGPITLPAPTASPVATVSSAVASSTPVSSAPQSHAAHAKHSKHPVHSTAASSSTSAAPSTSARATSPHPSRHPSSTHRKHPHPTHSPHPTHTKSPTKTKSSSPPSSTPPTTTAPPPPPADFTLTVEPGTATVFVQVDDNQVQPFPCVQQTSCTYTVANGAAVSIAERGGTFAEPSSCVGATSCAFTMTDDTLVRINS